MKPVLIFYLIQSVFVFLFCSSSIAQTFQEFVESGFEKRHSGDLQGAIIDYTKAIDLDPTRADVLRNRASAKYMLRDYRGAIADWTRVIEIETDIFGSPPAGIFILRGWAKIEIGQKESACLDFSKAGEYGDPDAYTNIEKHCK